MIDRVRIAGTKSTIKTTKQIISMMPTHRVYFEGFGGTGAVMRRKRPALENIIIEKDDRAAAQLAATMGPGVQVIHGDVFDHARSLLAIPDLVAYFDPPYVMGTRRSSRAIYRHEFTDVDHRRLWSTVTDSSVRARILISGYAGSLYEGLFRLWRQVQFTVMTRGGPAVESVWCNFDPPAELHDARFVGRNFTDRQRIKRKAKRWADRIVSMPAAERAAILEHIQRRLSAPAGALNEPT